MASVPTAAAGRPAGDWSIVARQELRDVWVTGRGLPLTVAFSVVMSAITYLGATNQGLNFLERRETVNLAVQVAVAVGALLALMVAADAISGERERGTLESLLLTPVSRRALAAGKLLGALSLWLAALVVAVPYMWFLGRGVGALGDAVGAAFVAGTLVAVAFGALGLIVSSLVASNRLSLSASLFVLLALYAPTQLPPGAKAGWVADLLLRVNPVTAAEHYITRVVINQSGWTLDAAWLISPVVAAVGLMFVALYVVPRFMTLRGSAFR